MSASGKVHLVLKSVMRDSYDSLHTVSSSAIDVPLSETVESFKTKALAALGEITELYDVHHTKCRFLVGAKIISSDEDSKTLAEVGVKHDESVDVILPIGHDVASPKTKPAASTSPSPSSSSKKIHLELKSVLRDSYDSLHTAATGSVDIDVDTETVEGFKVKALAVLGEFAEIRDVHHTKCKFNIIGGNAAQLTAEKDSQTCKQVGLDHDAKVEVLLPIGHDK